MTRAAAEFAAHVLKEEAGGLHPEAVADQGWEAQARAGWTAFAIQDNLWIYPNDAEAPPEHLAVHLDPGLAFGTGTHPTTRLCLQWLYATLATAQWVAPSILDFGCGSGILAIAALRLGGVSALGVDVDPLALAATQENARRNGVAAGLRVQEPPIDPDGRYTLVVANILAGPLIAHGDMLARAVAPNGRLALSGILADQVNRVRAAFPTFELALTVDEGWCLLHGGRT